jgi:hypothetical protein
MQMCIHQKQNREDCPMNRSKWHFSFEVVLQYIYGIAEKTPQQKFEGNTTMSAIITSWVSNHKSTV